MRVKAATSEAAPSAVRWDAKVGVWLVTGHYACLHVLSDDRFGVHRNTRIGENPAIDLLARNMLVDQHGDAHTSVRRILAPFFRPAAIARLHDRINGMCTELLDAVASEPEIDVVATLAEPRPALVMRDLLELNGPDFAWFAACCLRLNATDADPDRSAADLNDLRTWVAQRLDGRVPSPDGSVLAGLARMAACPRGVDPDLVVANLFALYVGGIDTTRDLISSSIMALYEHLGSAWLTNADDADDAADRVINETARAHCPLGFVMRRALTNVVLAGVHIRAGDPVCVLIARALRDPNVYPDPGSFDPEGPEGPRPLFFGAGSHYCLGARLARQQCRAALLAIARRRPTDAIAPESVTVRRDTFHRGLRTMALAGRDIISP